MGRGLVVGPAMEPTLARAVAHYRQAAALAVGARPAVVPARIALGHPGMAGNLRSVRATTVAVHLDTGTGTGTVRLDEVRIAARNVRLGTTLVRLQHVEVQVRMGQTGLDAMLDSGLPYARLQLAGGVGRAQLESRPDWGHIELTATVVDGGLVLLPTALVTGGVRWPAAARLLPRLRIGADVLLPGSRITAAAVVDDRLQLTAEMDDVALPLRTGRGEVVVDLNETGTDDTVTVDLPGVAEPVTLRGGTRRDAT